MNFRYFNFVALVFHPKNGKQKTPQTRRFKTCFFKKHIASFGLFVLKSDFFKIVGKRIERRRFEKFDKPFVFLRSDLFIDGDFA